MGCGGDGAKFKGAFSQLGGADLGQPLGVTLECPWSFLNTSKFQETVIQHHRYLKTQHSDLGTMVTYNDKTDQFGSLLSNVSGVGSGAFQKRALKDVKAPDTSKDRPNPFPQGQARRASEYGNVSDMSRGQGNGQQKPRPSAQSFSNASSVSSGQSNVYSYNASSKSASAQFDNIFGDLDSNKQSR